jgi:hypothetical protein
MAALHDCADHQPSVLATFTAAQDTRTVIESERLSAGSTMRANETALPAGLFQIGGASHFVGEKPLKFRERLREG